MDGHSDEREDVFRKTARRRFWIFGVCAALYLAAVGYAIWFAIRNAAGGPFAGFLLVILTFPTSMAATSVLRGFAPAHNAGATFWAPVGALCALLHVGIAYLLVKHSLRRDRSHL